jgi:MFS family permease
MSASARLIHQKPFVLFWFARLTNTMGFQMLALMIGWQVYQLTNDPLDLGLIGLIQFVPAVPLTLLIGHIADRYDRRLIVRAAQSVYAVAALMIVVAILTHTLNRNLLFTAVFLLGCARAFELPTGSALVPALVPAPLIPRAVAAWTSANQTATICGPALGGLIYAFSPLAVGIVCVVFFVCAITFVSLIRLQ